MIAKSFFILSLLLSHTLAESCLQPQSLFRQQDNSFFLGTNDIQQAVTTLFASALDNVKFTSGIFPLKSEFLLKNIEPIVIYKSEDEKETLGTNTITRNGGFLEISVNFGYQFADRSSVGLPRAGEGKAVGKFTESFPVELTQTAQYTDGQVQWTAQFTNLLLPNLIFLKESGTDLKEKELNTLTEMLNISIGSGYVSVKTQLQNRLTGMQDFISNFNNQISEELFPQQYEYVFQGKKISYDYSVKGYSLAQTGENIDVLTDVLNFNNECLDLSLYPENTSYVSLSQSVIDNSFNYLSSTQQIKSIINDQTWKIDNFYYTIRDMAWIIPQLTDDYQYTDKVAGSCQYASGNPPTYVQSTNSFDTTLKFSCILNAVKDNKAILNFDVNSFISLVPSFNEENSVLFKVVKSSFTGTNFVSPTQYPIAQPSLAAFYISQAANQYVNLLEFGTQLITLDGYKSPQWKVSQDAQTIIFYDNISPSN